MKPFPRDVARVYVRMPNWVGDVVMATPFLRAVRAAWPAARVTLGLRGWSAATLAGTRLADELWTLDRGESRPFGGLGDYVRRLRAGRFDVALLLTNSLGTALAPALARIPVRAGYDGDGRYPLLTHRVPKRLRLPPQPMPELYARVHEAVGVPSAGPAYELPLLPEDVADADRRLAALGVDPRRPLMALNPGAKFGGSKLWAPERFAAVGDELVRRYGADVLVLVGPEEKELGARVVAAARERLIGTHDAVVPLAPLRAVAARLKLMVVNDTGPRHIAVAFGVPTVCVMGSTHPRWTDWLPERQRVVRVDVPCGPCHLKTCPLDHRCMNDVPTEAVVRAAAELLG